jgi:formylglycine-generating enzyme required for sulfatase activity
MMGNSSGGNTEKPIHEVTVPDFYMARYEITVAQLKTYRRRGRALPKNTSKDGMLPATWVLWKEAVKFCEYLADLDKSGARYRLPTEAEWEYAARGPSALLYPWGNEPPTARHANITGTADGFVELAPVGRFPSGATASGIHDLAGNVMEWCSDWYGPYPAVAQSNPMGASTGKLRVIRGGAFEFDAFRTRSAARAGRRPDNGGKFVGFRVVRELTRDEALFLKEARGHE